MRNKSHSKTLIRTNESDEFYTDERCHILEIINSEEHPDVSIARARVEPGVTTELHHLDGEEIYYILSGTGRADIDGQVFDVQPGDAVDIKRGVHQRITNTGENDLVFLCICSPRWTPDSYHTT